MATFQNLPDLVRTFQSLWQSFQIFHTFAEASRTGQNVIEALATFQNSSDFYEASRISQIVPERFSNTFPTFEEAFRACQNVLKSLATFQNFPDLRRRFSYLPERSRVFCNVQKFFKSL